MAGQTAFPNLDDLARMRKIARLYNLPVFYFVPVRAIKKYMPKARAHNCGQYHVGNECIEYFVFDLFSSKHFPDHKIAHHDARYEEQAI